MYHKVKCFSDEVLIMSACPDLFLAQDVTLSTPLYKQPPLKNRNPTTGKMLNTLVFYINVSVFARWANLKLGNSAVVS